MEQIQKAPSSNQNVYRRRLSSSSFPSSPLSTSCQTTSSLPSFPQHQPQDSTNEPKEFKIQLLPAGSAPKKDTHQPNVNGELAPGLPNNAADTTYDNKIEVQKGLGDDGLSKKEKDEREGHKAEIKSASEREPESADSIWREELATVLVPIKILYNIVVEVELGPRLPQSKESWGRACLRLPTLLKDRRIQNCNVRVQHLLASRGLVRSF